MTFTHDKSQLEAAKAVPLDKLVLETDAPFLAPAPFRGKTCEPKHIAIIAEFLANLRSESLEKLAKVTTQNAIALYGLDGPR
jgi:TatD DNase family protein